MAMVVVDNSSLQADSQHKSGGGLVWGSVVTWHCSTFIKWTKWPYGHDDRTV